MVRVDAALRECADVFEQRAKEYGPIEPSFTRAAIFASLLTGLDITAAHVARVLIAVKLSRLAHQPGHDDSMVDASVYLQIVRALVAAEDEGSDQ
jgi:hypothetical protein